MTQRFSAEPMMSNHEIEIINNLLGNSKPKICLEWGSGGSTIYFPKNHTYMTQWISIEHNGHYIDFLKDKILLDHVTHLWIASEVDYVDCVKKQGRRYDFILVDGLVRGKCLEAAKEIVKETGFVLLHDSGRKEYEPFFNIFPHCEKLCDGEVPVRDGGFAHRGLMKFWL